MKVIHLSNFAYQYTVPLVNSISKKCDCIFLSPDSNHGSIFLEKLSENVVHEKYPNIRISNLSNIFKAKEMLNTIEKYNPDVLHLQHHGDMWLSYLIKCVPSNFSVVNTVHDMEPHPGFERYYHKYHSSAGISITDKFVVHGESLKNQFLKKNLLDEKQVNIISHGNYDIYKEISNGLSKEEPNTVLFFGKLYEYKGLKYLLKAVPLICEKIPDFRLILAVHGDPFSKYKKYLPNSYMKHLEIIEDYIPDTEVGRLFSRAAAVVLPYISASQSGVVPLSYSFAKPVVATDVGALSEIIVNGKTGFIGNPRDIDYLSEKIIYLLENPQVRLEIGNKAKEYSITKLSWDSIGEDYFRLYKSFNYEN